MTYSKSAIHGQACQLLHPSSESENRRELFQRVTVAASQAAKLGIFNLECTHRFVQTLTQSSKHLGRAKAYSLLAAETVLNTVVQQHRLRMKQRLGTGKWYSMPRQISVVILNLEFNLDYYGQASFSGQTQEEGQAKDYKGCGQFQAQAEERRLSWCASNS